MSVLAVHFDVRTAETTALLERLKGKGKRAVRGAMKDIGKMVRTQMAREITKRIKVAYGSVLKRIRIFGPSTDLTMRVILDEKARPGLMAFGAKQLKRGVSYKIEKSGPRKVITGAFIAKGNKTTLMRGKRTQERGAATGPLRVFQRVGKSRLPVYDSKGPSLNAVVTKNDIDEAQKKVIESKLPDRILARLRLADSRSR